MKFEIVNKESYNLLRNDLNNILENVQIDRKLNLIEQINILNISDDNQDCYSIIFIMVEYKLQKVIQNSSDLLTLLKCLYL